MKKSWIWHMYPRGLEFCIFFFLPKIKQSFLFVSASLGWFLEMCRQHLQLEHLQRVAPRGLGYPEEHRSGDRGVVSLPQHHWPLLSPPPWGHPVLDTQAYMAKRKIRTVSWPWGNSCAPWALSHPWKSFMLTQTETKGSLCVWRVYEGIKKQTIRATPGRGLLSASRDHAKERRVSEQSYFLIFQRTLGVWVPFVQVWWGRAVYIYSHSETTCPFLPPSVSLPGPCWGFGEFAWFCSRKSLTRRRTLAL